MGTPVTGKKAVSGLWAYNARILLGNTYWLIIAPTAATQLVLFWGMATAVLTSVARATQTIELLAPILAAFLCAHALAPEEDGVGELVFIRPVSVERVLLLRLCLVYGFVCVLLAPAFAIFNSQLADFPLLATSGASIPSVLVLSMVAMAVASLARSPMLGFAAAASYWGLDVALGGYLNPLVTLHGYADSIAGREMSELWWLNKLVLLVIAASLYLWHRRLLTRPPTPRHWSAALKAAGTVVLLLAIYVTSGALYKVAYGVQHEGRMGRHVRVWYQQQFRGYGPLPVAWMFGPAFAHYVEAEAGREALVHLGGGTSLSTKPDVSAMEWIVQHYPDSMWADNAQFELALDASRRPLDRPWALLFYERQAESATAVPIAEDIEGAAREYALLADRYPGSPLAPLALSEVAATQLRRLDFEGARAAYERLVSEHGDSPESWPAGLALADLCLREGRFAEAVRAADVAARTAPWDRVAEALVLGARAAQYSGQTEEARDRYRRAARAARDAVERATRGEKTPSRVPKTVLFPTSNAIMTEAERALSGRLTPPPVRPPEVTVRGRVIIRDRNLEATRVALGSASTLEGLPSPFAEGPAVSASVDAAGRFVFSAVAEGRYTTLACLLRSHGPLPRLQVTGPDLPVDVEMATRELPTLQVGASREIAPATPSVDERRPDGPADRGRASTRPGGPRSRGTVARPGGDGRRSRR